ncbi:MAG: dacF, partial [Verrucomicrobiaceae bacterium]|nr:dacF [Verrucomicrobiaceae bacterium]
MPSARLQLSTLSHRAAAWLRVSTAVCMLGLTSCDDPKKEAQIRWREEEIAAKEADLASREKALLDQRRAAENLQAQIKQQGEALVAREKALKDNEDKIKQAKVAWETKLRRGPAPSTTCERVAVIDPASDEVYFERNGDKRGAIASTTKIMTALLLAEAGDLDKELTIEEVDTKCAPVRIGLKAGETYTRRDLLTALMVKSSNDIAQALARDNAGSIEAFAEKMNQRAKDLGC